MSTTRTPLSPYSGLLTCPLQSFVKEQRFGGTSSLRCSSKQEEWFLRNSGVCSGKVREPGVRLAITRSGRQQTQQKGQQHHGLHQSFASVPSQRMGHGAETIRAVHCGACCNWSGRNKKCTRNSVYCRYSDYDTHRTISHDRPERGCFPGLATAMPHSSSISRSSSRTGGPSSSSSPGGTSSPSSSGSTGSPSSPSSAGSTDRTMAAVATVAAEPTSLSVSATASQCSAAMANVGLGNAWLLYGTMEPAHADASRSRQYTVGITAMDSPSGNSSRSYTSRLPVSIPSIVKEIVSCLSPFGGCPQDRVWRALRVDAAILFSEMRYRIAKRAFSESVSPCWRISSSSSRVVA